MAKIEEKNRKLLKCIKSNKAIAEKLIDIRRCLEQRAEVNTIDFDGRTPLHLAVLLNERKIIAKLLLKWGAKVNTQYLFGYKHYACTVLHDAVRCRETSLVELLLRHGADFDAETFERGTPLHVAARYGNMAAIELLLDKGANVNVQSTYGHTPLHEAANFGQRSNVEMLLNKGADVDVKTTADVKTPLHEAADSGQAATVEMLLNKGADINAQSRYGYTALMMAARSGHLSVVELLLIKNADVNLQTKSGSTVLHIAVVSGHMFVVDLLQKKGTTVMLHTIDSDMLKAAEVNAQNKDGYTPLIMAARSGHMSVVELLLEKGAHINARSYNGSTPLIQAATSGHMPVVQLLLNKGANLEMKTKNGKTALHEAASSGHVSIVELLLNQGAEVDVQEEDGNTPFILAARSGHMSVVELLLNRGAKINKQNTSRKHAALHAAAQCGEKSLIELLLKRGADVNLLGEYGDTPLHEAVSTSVSEVISVVNMLLKHGADIDAQNKDGITPLHIAVRDNRTALIAFLVNCGADVSIKNREGDTPYDYTLIFCVGEDFLNVLPKKKVDNSRLHTPDIQGNVPNKRLELISNDTSGFLGQLYEAKMLSLVFLRLLNHEKLKQYDILLGTNISNIGAMDDICLRFQVTGELRPIVVFMQVKHREDPDKGKLTDTALWSDSGDFSLAKYFYSFLNIRERFRTGNEDPMFEGEFKDVDCYFVLYTSAKDSVTKKNTEQKLNEIMHYLISSEQNTNPFQYNYNESDINRLIKVAADARFKNSNDESAPNLNLEEYNTENTKDFFNKLWFYSSQAMQDEVERKVIDEISEHYNSKSGAIHFKFERLSKAIFLRSHDNIQKWWMQKGNAPYLTRSDDFFSRAKQTYLDEVWLTVFDAMSCLKISVDVKFNQHAQIKHNNNSIEKPEAFNKLLHRLFKMIDTENILITVDNDLKRNILNLLLCENHSQNAYSFFSRNGQDVIDDDNQQDYQPFNYSKRSGTAEVCGVFFRTKLLSLVLLRMLHNKQIDQDLSPLLVTKISGIGLMNDICLRYRMKGEERPLVLFMHLKHVEKHEKGRLTNESLWCESGEFSLHKHFASYIMIKERFQVGNKEPMFNGEISDVDCYFGLYTTAIESISKKKTENKMNNIVQGLVSTRQNTEPFQCEYDDDDIERLCSITVIDEIVKLVKVFVECLKKPKKLNPNLLSNQLIARYHVVMGREMLRPCDEQPEINKYRMWQFRSEFFNSNQEYMVALRKNIFNSFTNANNREQLKSSEIKLPLTFGNLDMTFSENKAKAQKRMKTLADELASLLELNNNTNIVEITDDDVGPGKAIDQNMFDINGGIGSAVGNLLVYDAVSNMLKIDSENEALPHNAASVLRELKDDKHTHINKNLSNYRIRIHIRGFPKISIDDNLYNKIQARYFLNKFWIFCNQSKEDKVESILREEIKEKYSNNQIRYNHNKCKCITDFIPSSIHDTIQKLWIQIKEPYLSHASDLFESAEEEDICNLLQTVINYMYLYDIYSIGIKIQRTNEKKSEQVHSLLITVAVKLFKLFKPDFDESIHFSQFYNFETSQLSLIVHPEMEWVALVMTDTTHNRDGIEYRIVAKVDPRGRPTDGVVLSEYFSNVGIIKYRDCFKDENENSWIFKKLVSFPRC